MLVQNDRGGARQDYSRYNNNNSNEVVAGPDGHTYEDKACYECQFKGHYRNTCPYAIRSGTKVISTHIGYVMTQEDRLLDIPKSWLLLNTCSVRDVANNPDIVTNCSMRA